MSDTNLEKVLIIDDNSDYRKLIKTFINKLLPGVECIEYDPVSKGIPDDNFDWSEIDVLLLDHQLSIVGTTGLDILHQHHKKASFPATIMLTGTGTEEIAIRALKSGIYEYQAKQSLTKDKLKQSIIYAWEAKKTERIKKLEETQHNRSFSKEVFYESLEQATNQNETERALVVIKPDDIDLLEEEIGIIGRDNLVNHIAKNSFEVFKLGACNPNITRISDTEIGVQIDFPNSEETLNFNMQGLSKHLAKCTFKFSEYKYQFSVSIGVLKLGVIQEPADQLILIASAACKKANSTKGNSYYLWQPNDDIFEFLESTDTEIIVDELSENDNEIALKAIEEKETLESKLKAAEDAKKQAEAIIQSEQEAKKNLEAELKLAEEEKKKAEAESDAQAELHADQQEKQKVETALIIEEEEQAKLQIEAEMKALIEENNKLKYELKAVIEAKQSLETELTSLKNTSLTTPAGQPEPSDIRAETKIEIISDEITNTPSVKLKDNISETKSIEPLIQDAEIKIKKLIDEKRIIQTYQSVIAMFDDEQEIKEIYKTGLLAIAEDEELNKYLSDTSQLTISLQQIINEWVIRQVFLRITENGTAKCKCLFLVHVTESWFTNITFFNWLIKILSQTKKYNPGASIILDVPLDLFNEHHKRAQALIETLHKTHQFKIALSNIQILDNIVDVCTSLYSNMIMMDIEQLHKLTAISVPQDGASETKNMLHYLKSKNIRIVTSGIENSTLLTDAITAGTDYTLGSFVGEIQDNLVQSHTVESFELT